MLFGHGIRFIIKIWNLVDDTFSGKVIDWNLGQKDNTLDLSLYKVILEFLSANLVSHSASLPSLDITTCFASVINVTMHS